MARTSPDRRRHAALAAAAAALAAGELLLAIHAGGLPEGGRAEALPFLALRPWLLILAAAIAAPSNWRIRAAFYGWFLALAGLAETAYLLQIGASDPWPEAARGGIASAALLVPIDWLVKAAGRWGRRGRIAAAASLAALLLVPIMLRPYWALVLAPEREAPAAARPDLKLMTALPIVWGEGGAFDPASRPAGSYRALQEEYAVRPIDALDSDSLAGTRLLLLAQPRWLSPGELAELDAWVRGGGRLLILTDPELDWPTRLPLGDIRRPPPVGLLAPLLSHWGLELQPTGLRRPVVRHHGPRRAALFAPGRFAARRSDCVVLGAELARCRLGAGRAVLLADADLMRDDLWMGGGPDGGARHRRIADNPLFVADLLDELAGIERPRAREAVAWAAPTAPYGRAELNVLLALVAAAAAGLLLARRPQR